MPEPRGLEPETVYEFFAPFAHIPGKYEWCRIRSPTHGIFDCFIVLGATTAEPATVYVASSNGLQFMAQRYPECTTIEATLLELSESADGLTVGVRMQAGDGPLTAVDVAVAAEAGVPVQVPYGGANASVWGSRFTCWGVDLNLPGKAQGHIAGPDGRHDVGGADGIVAVGSFGRITAKD